jgi:hypothetical protein
MAAQYRRSSVFRGVSLRGTSPNSCPRCVFTRDKAREAVRNGMPLDSLRKTVDFTDFIQRLSEGDLVRESAFDNFYRLPALQRAYDEAKFESQGAAVRRPLTPSVHPDILM